MLDFLTSLFHRYVGFCKGCVILRWEFVAVLTAIWIGVSAISSSVHGARRNRLHELEQERENLRERLRLMREQLREMDRSFGPVQTIVNQRVDSLTKEGESGIPRLRLNADGSITEYS